MIVLIYWGAEERKRKENENIKINK